LSTVYFPILFSTSSFNSQPNLIILINYLPYFLVSDRCFDVKVGIVYDCRCDYYDDDESSEDESYDYFGSGEDVDDRDYSTGHQELEIIDHLQQNNVTHQNNTTGHQKSKIIDVTQNTNSTEYQESVEVINGPLGDKGSGHNTGHQELGGVNVDNVIVIETGNY